MASATKSIRVRRSPQRIPPEEFKRFERSPFGALWILVYATTAAIVVTTAILAAVCVSVSRRFFGGNRELRSSQNQDRRMKP
jgi:hypothetical protein